MPLYGQIPIAYRAVILAGGLLVFGLLFQQLVTLLVAILVTVIISIPIAQVADRLERRRIPRPIGALIGLFIGVGTLAVVLALVIPPFVDQAEEFVDEVPATIEDLEALVGDLVGADPAEVGDSVQEFLQRYVDNPETLIDPITSIGLSVVGVLGALIFMLLTAYFIAARPQPLIDGMLALVPPARRDSASALFARLRDSWVGWLQGVLVDMLVTGVLLYVGLTLIGLDFAIFFAVFSALLVVIPYFGAIIGAVPVVLFALAESPGTALAALIVYLVVQQIESNMIIPLVMAQRVKLHPALIAIGVVLVGQLFGFIGLFVAVPIISGIVILVDELWAKPLDAAKGVVPASELATPEGSPGPAAAP
jgi:predicted PurR-regulated permease PerM